MVVHTALQDNKYIVQRKQAIHKHNANGSAQRMGLYVFVMPDQCVHELGTADDTHPVLNQQCVVVPEDWLVSGGELTPAPEHFQSLPWLYFRIHLMLNCKGGAIQLNSRDYDYEAHQQRLTARERDAMDKYMLRLPNIENAVEAFKRGDIHAVRALLPEYKYMYDNLQRKCAECKRIMYSMPKCSGCRNVYYCTRECQVKHWPVHKTECVKKNRLISLLFHAACFHMCWPPRMRRAKSMSLGMIVTRLA
jgi:hypothetical protein